jgi:hypothetical protein
VIHKTISNMFRSFPFLVVALCAVPAVLHAQDTEAPMLGSIDILPASVDVATSDASVMVDLDITDDSSGFNYGNIFLYKPGGGFVASLFFNVDERTSGDALDGSYSIPVTVSQYSPPGTWSVGVLLVDSDFNQRTYGPDPGEEAFPIPGAEEFTVTNAGTVDSAPPVLSNLVIAPGVIDTSSGDQQVMVSFDIDDALSGFRSGFVNVYDPSFNFRGDVAEFVNELDRVSGDASSGSYEVMLTVPAFSPDGTWQVDVSVRDLAGNSALPASGSGTFSVNNSSGAGLGGLADAVDATQYSWQTSGDADWFVQADTTYDGVDAAQSGAIGPNSTSEMEVTVQGPGTLSFWWKVDCEAEEADFLDVEVLSTGESEVISGDADWDQVSLAIPPGPQTVRWTYSKDGSVNAGADAGWVDRVQFLGDSDTEPPVLQAIRVDPNPVDISMGDQILTITLEISDDFNGASSGDVYVYDPFGNEYDFDYFDFLNQVEGDANFGVYEVEVDIYQSDLIPEDFFSLGAWYVEVEIYDDNGAASRYYASDSGDPFPIPGAEVFGVTNGGGGGGLPSLLSINSITPNPVDATAGATSITVEFDIDGGDNGFSDGNIFLNNDDGGFVDSVFFDFSDLVASSGSVETYSVTIPIPQYAPAGFWSLDFCLYDFAANEVCYPFEVDFPNPGDEVFEVTNTGLSDTTGPMLNSFSMSPGAVDTSAGPGVMTVDCNVTDDLAGIRGIFLFVYNPSDEFQFTVTIDPASGVAGDYSTTFEIPQGSVNGTWEVSLFTRDFTGNTSRYGRFGTAFPTPGEELIEVGPITGGSTFDNFIGPFSLTGDDALPGGNPDGDLFSNALELLLGLSPVVADLPAPSVFGIEKVGNELHLEFTVDPGLTVGTNGTDLEISDGSGTPFLVTGQTGSNLVDDWADQLPAWVSGTTYRVTLPVGPATEGFVRLGLTFP